MAKGLAHAGFEINVKDACKVEIKTSAFNFGHGTRKHYDLTVKADGVECGLELGAEDVAKIVDLLVELVEAHPEIKRVINPQEHPTIAELLGIEEEEEGQC